MNIEHITKKNVLFYEIDVTNSQAVGDIFQKHKIDGVIHFAGLKAVGESKEKPFMYYQNNVVCTLVLIHHCLKYNVPRFVFSSSATVYGENDAPFVETMDVLRTSNPYGETKAICERILTDMAHANPSFSVSLLRYFNPVGAHPSGLIGEDPIGIPNNLMPYLTQVAKGQREYLRIFGNDYPTIDGTGIRDYLHVMDLAEGHIAALEALSQGVHIYNLGTGKGTSVLQLLKTFEETNGVIIPYEMSERRPGDIATCYADVSKAKRELGWIAKRTISTMCKDAWQFEQNNQHTKKLGIKV